MGIVFRQSIKASIVTLVGAILGAVCNFSYVVVLGQQANGFRTSIFEQASVLQFAILLGTSGTVATFIHRYAPGIKQKLLLTYAALAPIAGFLILLIPYAIFRQDIVHWYKPEDRVLVDRYYFWIPTLILLWSFLYQIEAYLTVHNKSAPAAFVREIVIRLINLSLIVLIYFKLISFSVFIIGCVLAYGVAVCLSLWIARSTKNFGFTLNWRAFTRSEYKELAHFSWYHLLMGISVIAMPGIGSYMLGILSPSGLKSVAVFGIATFISGIMIIPFRAMAAASYASLNAAYTNNDFPKVHELFHRSSINIFIVSVLMSVLIGCNLHNAAYIIHKPGYEAMSTLVIIMMIGKLTDCAAGMNTELISFSSFYKFNFRISAILIALLILFNTVLIPRFDVYGAAWGMTITLILFNIAKIIFLYRKFQLHSFSKETLLVILAGTVAAIIGYILPHIPNIFIDAAIRTLIIIAVYGAMMLWLKPSDDLRNYLKSVKEKKKLF